MRNDILDPARILRVQDVLRHAAVAAVYDLLIQCLPVGLHRGEELWCKCSRVLCARYVSTLSVSARATHLPCSILEIVSVKDIVVPCCIASRAIRVATNPYS